MEGILFVSLFLPWITLNFLDGRTLTYYAFSPFSLYSGYSILLTITIIPFFLLSHSKKERIRALVPFRLSDTQAIVFVISILLTTLLNLIIVNTIFSTQVASMGTNITTGYKIAFSALIIILISTYFLSKSTKTTNTDICYLDHQIDDELLGYNQILKGENEKKKKNMSLPI